MKHHHERARVHPCPACRPCTQTTGPRRTGSGGSSGGGASIKSRWMVPESSRFLLRISIEQAEQDNGVVNDIIVPEPRVCPCAVDDKHQNDLRPEQCHGQQRVGTAYEHGVEARGALGNHGCAGSISGRPWKQAQEIGRAGRCVKRRAVGWARGNVGFPMRGVG